MLFGHFNDEKTFTISLGERVQLKEIAGFATKIFDTCGPIYFADKKNAKLVNFHNTIDCGKLGRLFTYEERASGGGYDEKELKSTLYNHVVDIFESANRVQGRNGQSWI